MIHYSTENEAQPAILTPTVWLTGLSGSGKSTIAYALKEELSKIGTACLVLDGDIVRKGLGKDLGFTPKDRKENVRRVAEVARLANSSGVLAVVAMISPIESDRGLARQVIGENSFIEVYVSTSLRVCEHRDVKGLYKRARTGELPMFTGISSPYEPPENAAYLVDTETAHLGEIIGHLIQLCQQQGQKYEQTA